MSAPTTIQKLMHLSLEHIPRMAMGDVSDAAMYRRRVDCHGAHDLDEKCIERIDAMYRKYFAE